MVSDESAADLWQDAVSAERAGRFDEACQRLRQIATEASGRIALDARLRFGRLGILVGEPRLNEAEAALAEARRTAEDMGLPPQQATAIHLLALLERRRGNLENAQRLLASSPVVEHPAAYGSERAQLHHLRGLIANDLGEIASAERHYLQALELYGQHEDQAGISEVCDSLAGVLLKQGKTKISLKFCRKSLELKRDLGDRFGEAITLGTMGRIYIQQARYQDALAAFADDLAIARELNDRRGIGIMLNSMGEACWLDGDLESALTHYRQSLQQCDETVSHLHSHLGLAHVHLSAHRLGEAGETADRMAELLAEGSAQPVFGSALSGLRGSLAWRQGNLDQGESMLRQAIAELRAQNVPFVTVPFLYELRDLLQQRGDMTSAVAVMTEALDLLSERGADQGVADVEKWLRTVDQPGLTRIALERHFPSELVGQVLSGRLNLPQPRKQRITILFSDIRDYTSMSEGLPAEEVVELLNEWFGEATRAVQRHQGIIDKFIGDAVMALFGVSQSQEDAAANAIRAALEMREALQAMNLRQQALGGRQLQIGIGIATGEAIVGFIGSHLRRTFTAIGDPVNTASRLEGATKNYDGCDILIGQATEEEHQRRRVAETKFLGSVALKGKKQQVEVYQVQRGL